MRMWMCDPRIPCRQHLLGEHNELHKLVGSLNKKRSITGYIKNDCVEPISLTKRHSVLVEEMERRGYNHQSPLISHDISYLSPDEHYHQINQSKSLVLLLTRCPRCHERFRLLMTDQLE